MTRCKHCGRSTSGRYERLGRCYYCAADLPNKEDDIVDDLIGVGLGMAAGALVESLFSSDSPGSCDVPSSDWSGGGGESGGGGASGDW